MNGLFDISSPNKRERLLVVVAGVLLVVIVVPFLYQTFGKEITILRSQRNDLKSKVDKLEEAIEDQAIIKKRLNDLSARSLPPGDQMARSLYQKWLMDTALDCGLTERRIDQGSISVMKVKQILYRRYTFTLHCKGSLEQLSEFLRRFHKSDYLHLVRKVSPRTTITRGSDELDLSIIVEALGLPQSRSRALPDLPDDYPTITEEENAMKKRIAERALFSEYSPPRNTGEPTRERVKNEFDHSPYTYVGSFVEGVDGKPQVWVEIRTEGKVLKLYEGEMFRLGSVRCYVRNIDMEARKVRFEAAGGFYTIKQGNSFVEYED